MEDRLLLRNARIVLPDRTTGPASVLIESGRIARIAEDEENLSGNISIMDLAGLTLCPGFIDIHIHGALGVDVMEAGPQGLVHIAEFLASRGITAWMPTLVPAPIYQYRDSIQAISECLSHPDTERAGKTQARILGVHYEGPFVNSEQCGALHREHFRTFSSASELDSLPTIKSDGAIHLMTLAPEIDGGLELIRELMKRNWVVSIGHTRATADILDQAQAAGARHMTHFMNAMTPLHHRAPGPVGWGLLRDDVSCDVIADGIHLDPSVLRLVLRAKSAERISLISDAIAATGLGDGEYQIWGEQIVVKDGRTQNARGRIAGSVITMLDAVRMMLSLGASENAVAQMASLNPARLLGIDNEVGSIAEGKRADLVALDADLNVRLTIIGGRVASKNN